MKYLINFSGSLWIIFAILWLLVAVSSILDSPAVYSSDLVFVTYWLYGTWGIVMGIFIFSRMFGNTPFSLHFWRVVLLIDIAVYIPGILLGYHSYVYETGEPVSILTMILALVMVTPFALLYWFGLYVYTRNITQFSDLKNAPDAFGRFVYKAMIDETKITPLDKQS